MEPDSATAERKRKASGASGIGNDDSNDGNSSRQGQALNMDSSVATTVEFLSGAGEIQ